MTETADRSDQAVSLSIEAGIATMVLSRPERANAMDAEFFRVRTFTETWVTRRSWATTSAVTSLARESTWPAMSSGSARSFV